MRKGFKEKYGIIVSGYLSEKYGRSGGAQKGANFEELVRLDCSMFKSLAKKEKAHMLLATKSNLS